MNLEEQEQFAEKVAEKAIEKYLEKAAHEHCLLAQQFENFDDVSRLVRFTRFLKMAETNIGRLVLAALFLGFIGLMWFFAGIKFKG